MATTAARTRRRSPARQTGEPIANYSDALGCRREIIRLAGARGSTLVIDRVARTYGDQRLIAHLCADEPPENAAIVCGLYLREGYQRCCRLLSAEDLEVVPAVDDLEDGLDASAEPERGRLTDSAGNVYRLHSAPDGGSLPQLRWHLQLPGMEKEAEPITLRGLTGALERYEPSVRLTKTATTAHNSTRACQ